MSLSSRRLVLALLCCLVILPGVSACSWFSEDYLSQEQSPGVDHPDSAGFRVITRNEITPPKPAFNFQLTDQTNSPLSLEDLRGSVVLITFLYTHCPEACPIVAANVRGVQEKLIDDVTQKDLSLVLITTDPENDDPQRLNSYTQALGGQWHFLTGSMDLMQEVWSKYDIFWEIKDRTQEIVVYHSYKTYLIDRDGQIRFIFVGVWFPDDIIPDIINLLGE
ncbi:MAG: SCO family protein [Anaerolineae bacterium]|nr:SCO family protein [Anaerolineae bacterium]